MDLNRISCRRLRVEKRELQNVILKKKKQEEGFWHETFHSSFEKFFIVDWISLLLHPSIQLDLILPFSWSTSLRINVYPPVPFMFHTLLVRDMHILYIAQNRGLENRTLSYILPPSISRKLPISWNHPIVAYFFLLFLLYPPFRRECGMDDDRQRNMIRIRERCGSGRRRRSRKRTIYSYFINYFIIFLDRSHGIW